MRDFIECNDYKIAFNLIDSGSKKWILLLPGGDKNLGKDRFKDWQEEFAKNGISSISVDFTGVGDSPGILSDTSLKTRIEETICVVNWLKNKFPDIELYLYGVSMGGYIALGTINEMPDIFKKLILQAPAAYSSKANELKFELQLPQEIRKPNSWNDSPSFEWLKEYKNPTLIIISEKDEIIPAEIIEKYKNISDTEIISLPIGHFLWKDMPGHKQARDMTYKEILNFIKK